MAQHSVLMTCRCLQSASPFHRAASLVRFCRMKPHAKSARMAPSEAVQRGCCSSHRTVAARDRGNSLFFLVVVVFWGFFFLLSDSRGMGWSNVSRRDGSGRTNGFIGWRMGGLFWAAFTFSYFIHLHSTNWTMGLSVPADQFRILRTRIEEEWNNLQQQERAGR